MTHIAIETCHLYWIYPQKMVIYIKKMLQTTKQFCSSSPCLPEMQHLSHVRHHQACGASQDDVQDPGTGLDPPKDPQLVR